MIGRFAQHPVACNLLMIIMILSGLWALTKLNTQFFPTFSIDYIMVTVPWSGASAEDAESAITDVLEDRFRTLADVKEVSSVSKQGLAQIWVRYREGTDLNAAADEIDQAISTVRNLPETAEDPQITILENRELINRLVVNGPTSLNELRPIIRRMETELLELGIEQVSIIGLPEEEIARQFTPAQIHELGLSLPEIANLISARSRDVPAGSLGRADVSRELRSVQQRRTEIGFQSLPLVTDDSGRLLTLGDVARVERRAKDDALELRYQGQLAVELALYRGKTDDALRTAGIVDNWLSALRPTLPPNVEITVYDQQWHLLRERINLLLKNGLSGLVLVIGILYLFLNGRVALWVTVGIPVSFLATLVVLYLTGGSINMISLFAMIMALGIIVDDAIVVGEDALAHYQFGEAPLEAAEGGARRMFWPVLSASMTTVAAFLPLMLIGDYIGAILKAIPWVVICVIIASLVESFLILPGHLRGAFHTMHHRQAPPRRQKLEDAFNRFRDQRFRPFVAAALRNRRVVLAAAFAAMLFVMGLMGGGRVGFVFFPTPEINVLIANVGFATGTPEERVSEFLAELETALAETDAELGGDLVRTAVTRLGMAIQPGTNFTRTGKQYAHIQVELKPSDQRDVRNPEFMSNWENRVKRTPGVETFGIFEPSVGPPGQDLEIRVTGENANQIKQAAQELLQVLRETPGVSGAEDDTPYGREQIIFELNPVGESLGLTTAAVGRQLRAAFDGELVQIFQDQGDEIEVRVTFADADRDRVRGLDSLPVVLPNGHSVPLGNVVSLSTQRGFERLRHSDGRLAIKVTGNVIEALANANAIRAELSATVLPDIKRRYPVHFEFTGQAEDQAETLKDMVTGLVYALALIYVVLAWVFGSYGWPLVVMSIIPFGIVGALFGHWVMGIDLTILSLFGLFGLSGIVVNDSIILVVFYKEQRAEGMPVQQALTEAACQRLRAVLLTSLTTIAGLTPLMFETSMQAQFLIPMATSITFGLAFTTGLVLVFVPTLLSLWEEHLARRSDFHAPQPPPEPLIAARH